MAEYLMPGDEIRPAIQTVSDLRHLMTRTGELHDGAPVYVRMIDEHGSDRGDSAILAVAQDADGALRLVVQR